MGITYYTDGKINNDHGCAAYMCIKDNEKIINFKQTFYTDIKDLKKSTMQLNSILLAVQDICQNNNNNNNIIPTIYSDSLFCVGAINLWIYRWLKEEKIQLNDINLTENLKIIMLIHNLKEKNKCKFVLEKIEEKNNNWMNYVYKLSSEEVIFT